MAWTDYYLDLADGGSGDGTSGDPFATYAEAITDIAAADANPVTKPTRIFVRGNLELAAGVAFSLAGTQENPVYWVGCTGSGTTWTRIGNASSDSRPKLTITGAANQVTVTAAFQHFEGLSFASASTAVGGTCYCTAADVSFVRCRFANTTANSASRAFRCTSSKVVIVACYFEATTTAMFCVSSDVANIFFGCLCNGGDIGLSVGGNYSTVLNCLVYGHSTNGINIGAGGTVANCTIVGGSGAAIKFGDDDGLAANNLLVDCATPIEQTTGTDGIQPLCCFNAWYNVTNDYCDGLVEVGSGDDDECASFGNTGLLAGDPLPNAAAIGNLNDFDLASAYRELAFPGELEGGAGYAYVGYQSHGAMGMKPPTLPAEEDVESGVTYGYAGDEQTGTYVGGGGIWMPRARQTGI